MENLFLYKLIILYMLDRIDFTLTNSQLCDFILDKGYTNLFNIHEAISELLDGEFISRTTIRDTMHYQITGAGEEALAAFENRIPNAIKQDILEFFQQEEIHYKKEAQIYSDYYFNEKQEYTVECVIKERKDVLLDIKFDVPTKGQALTICDNWRENSTEIYSYLVDKLWTPEQ